MQRQINMLNLFVEFRFQLFNMKTLFYFKLRISAGMIENLKTINITLIPTTFRSTEVFKNVGIFVPKDMLIKTCVKMPIGFTGYIFYISFKRNKRDRQWNKSLQQPRRSVLQEWRGRSVFLITMVTFAGCWFPFFLMVLDAPMQSSPFSPLPVFLERLMIFVGFISQLLNPASPLHISQERFSTCVERSGLDKASSPWA